MKRSKSRESLSIGRGAKRERYDGSSDGSPERGIRRRHEVDKYGSPPREKYAPLAHTYKVLCVSALHHKASDAEIKEILYREFKKYGDFNIRLSLDESRERIAYICFRTSEDARAAKSAKPRILIYEKVAIVEPVFEAVRRPRSMSPPEYERPHHYPTERYHRRPLEHSHYERSEKH